MILIGQYDSPFVRRVAIAMTLYGVAFRHRPWSTFGDGDKIAAYNPLRRAPTLILNDGRVIIESAYILDWLDEQVRDGDADVMPLIAAAGPERRTTLYYTALATGFARMATGNGLGPERTNAAKRLMAACMAEPFYVAGTGRACTRLMEAGQGRVLREGRAAPAHQRRPTRTRCRC